MCSDVPCRSLCAVLCSIWLCCSFHQEDGADLRAGMLVGNRQNEAMEQRCCFAPRYGWLMALRFVPTLLSCKSAVAVPSVRLCTRDEAPAVGFFSCSCHLEACNKFYGPGFIEHRRRGIEVPCLNLRLMFWKEQALSDECFDHSLPTFWRKSNARVPNLHLQGGHRALVPATPCLLQMTSVSSPACVF